MLIDEKTFPAFILKAPLAVLIASRGVSVRVMELNVVAVIVNVPLSAETNDFPDGCVMEVNVTYIRLRVP